MKVLCFQEREKIYPEKLFSKFLGDQGKNIVSKLELTHVLKHQIPRMDINNISRDEEEGEVVNFGEFYSFRFVGVLMVEDYCLMVYPKYIKDRNTDFTGNKKKFLQVIQVIDKYQKLNSYNLSSESESGNYLLLMLNIMRGYIQNGLYSNDESVIEVNGEGNILWEKTINESIVYLFDNAPFYLDLFTEKTVLNEMDIVRRLHAAIITEISKKIGDLLSIFGIPTILISDEQPNDFGDNHYLEYLIEQELSRQFVTSKQIVLKNLLRYIRETEENEINENIQMYGTTSFNLVWEDICKKIYRNHLEVKLSSLRLKLIGKIDAGGGSIQIDYSSFKLLKDIVNHPRWHSLKDGTLVSAKKSLELDVLHINHDKKRFEIFDGKYYTIQFQKNSVSGQPGVGDITKQYLYQLAYQKLANLNGYSFTNAFVVPVDELFEDKGDGIEFAMTEMAMMSELGLKNIKVIARDAEMFYSQYLRI